MEEEFIFPRFEKAGHDVELTRVLRIQHDAGRALTERILHAAKSIDATERAELPDILGQFTTMYLPHISREDSVLFCQIRTLMNEREYADLGNRFQEMEHRDSGKAAMRRRWPR